MSWSKHVIKGRFSHANKEEIFLSRGKTIKLLQIHNGEVTNIFEHQMVGVICSLAKVTGKVKGKNTKISK